MSVKNPSRFLWMCDRFSKEQLMRALLMADKIRFPTSSISSQSSLIEACMERGRIEIFPYGAEKRWFREVEGKQQEIYEWSKYFSEKICISFAAKRVVIELHEARHRIAWAWDDGSGMFPDTLFPRGDFVSSPQFDMDLWDQLEDELRQNSFGASAMAADYAVNVAPSLAKDRLLINIAMDEFAEETEPYTRIGLIARDDNQLNWLVGTACQGTAFEPVADTTLHSIITTMLGDTGKRNSLGDIPIDRFLDLCEELSSARNDFSINLARWSDTLARLPLQDRDRELAAIRRDEIIPAMMDYNDKGQIASKKVLKAISGEHVGKTLLAVMSVASGLVTGALSSPTIGGAFAVIGAGIAGSVIKDILNEKAQKTKSWTAFSQALNSEFKTRKADLEGSRADATR